jgi:hypothetical protein
MAQVVDRPTLAALSEDRRRRAMVCFEGATGLSSRYFPARPIGVTRVVNSSRNWIPTLQRFVATRALPARQRCENAATAYAIR